MCPKCKSCDECKFSNFVNWVFMVILFTLLMVSLYQNGNLKHKARELGYAKNGIEDFEWVENVSK